MRKALLAAAAALLIWPVAGNAARTLAFQEWFNITADLDGRSLVWSESATVRLDPRDGGRDLPSGLSPFVYYRVHVSRAPLDSARLRFSGQPDQVMALRTQIARLTSGLVAGNGAGQFVVMPDSRRFAVPVVWCCDSGVETVMLSDGRVGADVPVASAIDGDRVRILLRRADGSTELAVGDPSERVPVLSRAPFPGSPSPGRAAMSRGVVAWVDDDAPRTLRFGAPGDDGVVAVRSLRLPGDALRIWVDRGLALVAVRQNGRISLARVDLRGPRQRIVWRGTRIPPVAIGEGTVAVADGRRVLAGRGAPLRTVTRARGRVAAVAASGRRVAWFERIRREGERRTVVRIGRIN